MLSLVCAGGNCTESRDESHHCGRISALLSLVIMLKPGKSGELNFPQEYCRCS